MKISTRIPALLLSLGMLCLVGCGQGQVAIPAEEPTAMVTQPGESLPRCEAPEQAPIATTPEPMLVEAPMLVPRGQQPVESTPVQKPSVGQTAPPPGEFPFPENAEGTLLRKLLPPQVSFSEIVERTTQPQRRPGPQELENPSGFTTPALTGIASLAPLSPRGSPAPSSTLTESLPLVPVEPTTPVPAAFPVGKRTSSERLDPSRPPELPYLGTFVPDRASLEDATREMSLEAVLVAPIPVRTTPVPFVRQSIPDPFENRRVIQYKQTLPELNQPVSGPPHTP